MGSDVIDILASEDVENAPLGLMSFHINFTSGLFPVKHLCLYNSVSYMTSCLNSVQMLMSTVATVTGIPEDKQVLLIANGEALDPTERVCSYSSAGTVSRLCVNTVEPPLTDTSRKWTPLKQPLSRVSSLLQTLHF